MRERTASAKCLHTSRPENPPHQPWCTEHHRSLIDGDDRCRTRITATYGQLLLTHTPDDGTTITLFSDDGMTTMTPAAAEQLTHALTLFTRIATPTAVTA